jgi:hypothetical protein
MPAHAMFWQIVFAVDFDGTLCYSNRQELGEPNTMLIDYLLQEKAAGRFCQNTYLFNCMEHFIVYK